jgi:enoyl-CoA hydratase
MSGTVHLDRDGAVATITLDHPERRNAISRDMWQGMLDAATDIAGDSTTRVAVLRGAGDLAFASGADISQFGEQRADGNANTAYDSTTAKATTALLRLPMPLVAAIHGFCIGGGLAVALTADIRVSADDGQFAIPAARLGLGYGHAGIRNLMSLVGPSQAKHILFTARRFTATEALGMGLINTVVPKADLEAAVDELTAVIAENAPMTVAAVKTTVGELVRDPEDRDLAKADAAVKACFDSDDYKEGVSAFLEKRRANFEGH